MSRYRRSQMTSREATAAAAAGVVLAALAGTHHASATTHQPAPAHAPAGASRAAIAYARHQLGCAYVYGGTGPCSSGFDCSGLVQAAYHAAGVSIPRTSEEQWAGLRHVSKPRPGTLVFAPGSPIDPPPGHVGMYIGDGKVIEAYAAGTPVMITSLSDFAATSGGITGFAEVR